MQENRDINIICNENINFNRLKYTIDFINHHPLKPKGINVLLNSDCPNCLKIFYSTVNDFKIYIPAQKLFFSEIIPEQNELSANKYFHIESKVFSVENIKQKDNIFFDGLLHGKEKEF